MARSQSATPLEEPFVRRYHDEGKGSQGSRSPYQQDRDRILYSRAFRRLMHKTQVFVAPRGDHFRTRLTHTLEVAQIARSLARAIGLDEDLTEAIALAHDLGHPPFGHVGEVELDSLMREKEKNSNGFDHNVQTLRLVTRLEFIGHGFDGLNLTAATLEGLLKHHGVVERKEKNDKEKMNSFFPMIKSLLPNFDFDKPASLEAQCACLADEIAYNHHDLEDGLRAEFIDLEKDVFDDVPHVKEKYDTIGALQGERRIRRLISDLIGESVEDAIDNTKNQLSNLSFYDSSCHESSYHKTDLVLLSEEQNNKNKLLSDFLKKKLYGHEKVKKEGEKGRYTIRCLFQSLPENLHCWDEDFLDRYRKNTDSRALADYIAGMTDNYAYRVRDAIGGNVSVGIEETGGKHSGLE